MRSTTTEVGFIGLGRMGTAIAGRVADAGYDLVVWNRTPGKDDELVGPRRTRARHSLEDAVQRPRRGR